jgi:nucleotidyltransferase/DNA polymerase involved in DNA repair
LVTTLRHDCVALTIAAARNGRCGGGSCGVVLARCYVARLYGVGSAMPMSKALRGVGAAMQLRLVGDGITLAGRLAVRGERELAACYGRVGAQLGRLARGEDAAPSMPTPRAPAHSISAETTLGQRRSRRGGAGARVLAVVRAAVGPPEASLARHGDDRLKLKTADFRLGRGNACRTRYVAPYDTSPQGRG